MMFVDPDARRIFVRREEGAERYLHYDLLIGADGIRSAVRAGLVANHRDFDCSVSDIFARFKSVHIALPPATPGWSEIYPEFLVITQVSSKQ